MLATPKVQIAVCGKFHYDSYIDYILESGLLNSFLYSRKIRRVYKEKSEKGIKKNLFLKEYLLRFCLKFFPESFHQLVIPVCHDIWQLTALPYITKSDILHFMIHGTSQVLVKRAKNTGAIIIGEPVNAHPNHLNYLLNEEYEKLGIPPSNPIIPSVYERFLQEIDLTNHLLTCSHWIKKSYILNGYNKDKIHVIPYGVNLQNFNFSKMQWGKRDKFIILCVASITPRKGQYYLLEALSQMSLPNTELILVGAIEARMKPILKKYEGTFTHIPFCDHESLPNIYLSADIFVLPSVEDGFAVVVGEAMACGLPVIVSSNAGASEIVDHGVNGFIFDARSVDKIKEYIEILYLNHDLKLAMGHAAYKKARNELSWASYAQKLIQYYYKVFQS